MAVTLTATSEPSNVPPRVRLDVAIDAGLVGESVIITRTDPDGRTVPVRLADPAVMTGTAWIGYDYECPFGASVTYSASVTWLDPVAGGVRTNLATNPTVDVDAAGWLSTDALLYPVTRDTGSPIRGAGSAITTRTVSLPSITASWVQLARTDVALSLPASQGPFTASVTVRVEQANRAATSYLVCYDVAGNLLGSPGSNTVALPNATPTRVTASGTAPAGTAWARMVVLVKSTNAVNALTGERVWFDDFLPGPDGAYFDGDTTDTATQVYAWTGAAGASTSTETYTGPGIVTDTDSAVATLDVAEVWLIHPGVPALSMPLPSVKSTGERVRPVNRGIFAPYGRTEPIVVTDGKRKAVQASLTIRTRTLDEQAALIALTADAAPLLLNVPVSLGWGLANEYISLGDLVESREVEIGSDAGRLHSGAYHVVSRPIGGSQSQRTWADLMAECATWQDVMDRYPTWAEVLAPTTT